MRVFVLSLVAMLLFSCRNEVKEEKELVVNNEASEKIEQVQEPFVPSYDFVGLEHIFNKKDDKVHVINFWATWCKPCVEELPYFEKLNAEYKDRDVELILVSLDLPKQINKGLKNFIEKKDIQSEVIHLNDPDQNTWIPKVDPHWDGAIPATVIYKGDKKMFYAKSFTYEESEKAVKKYL
ncbi:MAG: TlpA family protein disulfide reductase [Flavobacteriaceae bacterium]|nr:TlpA family protein disulfide reductase [Flavobacteriaceae bacterium]